MTHYMVAEQAVVLLTCLTLIEKVPISNLGRDTDVSDLGLTQSLQVNAGILP